MGARPEGPNAWTRRSRSPRVVLASVCVGAWWCASCPSPRRGASGPKVDVTALPKAIPWAELKEAERTAARSLMTRVAALLSEGKTQRRACLALANAARAAKLRELPVARADAPATRPTAPFFFTFREQALAVYVPGELAAHEGLVLHVHSLGAPALALKPRPAYAKHGWTLLDTREHGTVDLPYWLSTPLALYGDALGDGVRERTLTLGEAPDSPKLVIPDLLIHLAYRHAQRVKLASREQLDPIVGAPTTAAAPEDADAPAVLPAPLDAIARTGGFATGEWTLVPAGPAQRLGADTSLLAGYGQAHRTLAFLTFARLTTQGAPKARRPQLLIFNAGQGAGDTERFFIRYAVSRALETALGPLPDEAVGRIWAKSVIVLGAQAGGALGRGVVVNARQSEVDRDVLRAALDLFRVHHVPHQLLDVRGASAAPGLTTLEAPVLELALPVGGAGRPYELTTLFDLAAATRALTALVRM